MVAMILALAIMALSSFEKSGAPHCWALQSRRFCNFAVASWDCAKFKSAPQQAKAMPRVNLWLSGTARMRSAALLKRSSMLSFCENNHCARHKEMIVALSRMNVAVLRDSF